MATGDGTAADASADDTVRRLSHELRNTIGAILGWLAVLRHGPGASPLMLEGIDAIERNVQRQSAALDELLAQLRQAGQAASLADALADDDGSSAARTAASSASGPSDLTT